MGCCGRCCGFGVQFGLKRAEKDLERYRRRGPNPITRRLLAELRRSSLSDDRLLDIGSGIGVIPAEFANCCISATLVEASSAYLDVAQREAGPRYGSAVQFVLGDFVQIAETVPAADVVTLDRVVCCYPDFEALLKAAAARANRLLVFSYPRDRLHIRAVFWWENFWRRLKGNGFRTFVHCPKRMREVLEAAGLAHVARLGTFVWIGDVYRRRGGAN